MIFYLETLLNTFTSFSFFPVDPLASSIQTIMSSTKKNIISFFLSGLDTISFSALPLTSCTTLNKVVRTDILPLFKGILSQCPQFGWQCLYPFWNIGTSQEKTLQPGKQSGNCKSEAGARGRERPWISCSGSRGE